MSLNLGMFPCKGVFVAQKSWNRPAPESKSWLQQLDDLDRVTCPFVFL